jgi:histidinol-phosphate/aromatic aminotransferase/cobyric acid decarboxylase-like protein
VRHAPRVHGGVVERAGESAVLDLSTCVDAFGLFEPVKRALREVEERASYRSYPDRDASSARLGLATLLRTCAERIDVAPGAAELLWTLVRVTLRAGDTALVWRPCFSEFEHAVAAVGARIAEYRSFGAVSPGDAHVASARENVARFADVVRRVQPKLAYLCAPTCPRGEHLPVALLTKLAEQFPATLFVVDQSYLNLSFHAAELEVTLPDNVIAVRSMTKELGLPGVRVGYALVTPQLRERLQAQRPAWSLSSHALAVFEVYGECAPLIAQRRQVLLEQARRLSDELAALGLRPALNDTHYFTVDVSTVALRGKPADAATWTKALRSVGIAVRDCASFGLPNHVRVVAHPEQSRLVQAWAQFLEAQVLEAQVVETQVVETQVVERQVPKGRTS